MVALSSTVPASNEYCLIIAKVRPTTDEWRQALGEIQAVRSQLRSSSLIDVFDRVRSSTRLTMTAQ